MAHEKWLTQQVNAAVAIGINPLDAMSAAKAFLALLPPGADPNTYVAPAYALEQDITSEAIQQDALASFVAREDVPSQWKLILAAGEANDGRAV